ncbi:MAG TPA: hypothetical protein VNF72_09990 [Myxococcota bacterium]|jgi:hypothetical protein|nr:hypothetical protein [Myxococcota bacterium]
MFQFWIATVAAIAFASWGFLVIELIGTWRFWPWVFRVGPSILIAGRRDASPTSPVLKDSFETSSARFHVVEADTWLFITGGFLKGSLALRGGRVIAQCRWPLGAAGFLSAWLLGLCSAGALVLLNRGELRNDTGLPPSMMLIGMLALAVAVLSYSLWLSRRTARRAIDEFVAHRAALQVN